nr:actin-binding protein wsp1-like [Lolium perenne]
MCLTKSFGSGDSGGDWELARPERRRRGAARRPGGRRELRATPPHKGNRFSPLAAAVAEAEGSDVEIWSSDEDTVQPPTPSPANLGRFCPDLGGGLLLGPPGSSPRVGSTSSAPPPPLESGHFPPLPGSVAARRCSSPPAPTRSGPGVVQIGAFAVELPPELGRTMAQGAPPLLGFAPAAAPLLLDVCGPVGPALGGWGPARPSCPLARAR